MMILSIFQGSNNMMRKACGVVCVALLSACASSPNEVVIRDAEGTIPSPDTHILSARADKVAEETSMTEPQQTATVPQRQSEKEVPPLQQKLLASAQQQLAADKPQQAIVLAEKGLRIDRKDAQFYLVLARAYQRLNDESQSRYFAQQGLRYAKKESQTYRELTRLTS